MYLQGIKEEVEDRKLPEEIYEVEYEYDEDEDDEDYVDRGQLLRRLKNLKTSLCDNIARVETLCVCWNKLNADMKELSEALRYIAKFNFLVMDVNNMMNLVVLVVFISEYLFFFNFQFWRGRQNNDGQIRVIYITNKGHV